MKKLFITGNLTKDVELRTVGEDKISVATLNVAANEISSDAEAVYFPVEVWRGTAEACAKNLKKGSCVSIVADVKANNYEKDGVKHYGYKFVADEIQFLSAGKKDAPQE